MTVTSAVDSGGAGARAPPEIRDSEKGRSLISAYRSLAITTNTPGFKKLSTALYNILRMLRVTYVFETGQFSNNYMLAYIVQPNPERLYTTNISEGLHLGLI